jgi:hypothetical protein
MGAGGLDAEVTGSGGAPSCTFRRIGRGSRATGRVAGQKEIHRPEACGQPGRATVAMRRHLLDGVAMDAAGADPAPALPLRAEQRFRGVPRSPCQDARAVGILRLDRQAHRVPRLDVEGLSNRRFADAAS